VTNRPEKRAYALGAILFLAAPSVSFACSQVCVVGEKVSDREWTAALRGALESTPIIVLGRVTHVGSDTDGPNSYPSRVATLEVIREWRGAGRASYRRRTGLGDADCGYPFAVGQIHLLFMREDGEWISSPGCPDPTKAEIRATIKKLDKLSGRQALALPRELR
jgi:hypothetical protein